MQALTKATAVLLTWLASSAARAQEPVKGYAPVNGLKLYYEVHGKGAPVILLHGSFMTITNNWQDMIPALKKTRQVIAVEMQGHGRTADIERDFSYENLADDVAATLDYLKVPKADVIGYSMGAIIALQVAIRHPQKVRKVVSISGVFRHDGWVKEALDALPQANAEAFKGTPVDRIREVEPDTRRVSRPHQARDLDGSEAVRLRRGKTKSDSSADLFHPRRCRRCPARLHRGDVSTQGR
jgi:pimeloyl-ACP methyl ester carboxylesterase